MFASKKTKAVIALISAVVLLMTSSVFALAEPFNYSNVDDVREKALKDFLAPGSILMFNTDSFVVDGDVLLGAKSGEKIETVTEAAEFNIIKKLNPSLAAGTVNTIQEGVCGEKTVSYKISYENGKEVSRVVLSETMTKAPVDKIVEYGNKSSDSKVHKSSR